MLWSSALLWWHRGHCRAEHAAPLASEPCRSAASLVWPRPPVWTPFFMLRSVTGQHGVLTMSSQHGDILLLGSLGPEPAPGVCCACVGLACLPEPSRPSPAAPDTCSSHRCQLCPVLQDSPALFPSRASPPITTGRPNVTPTCAPGRTQLTPVGRVVSLTDPSFPPVKGQSHTQLFGSCEV